MKFEKPKYEFPVLDIAWTSGIGHPGAIFLWEGRSHVAAEGSPAAYWLEERGALRIGTMRFDPDPLERAHPERPVRPLGRRQGARAFPSGASEN
jgi:hypothetical protein